MAQPKQTCTGDQFVKQIENRHSAHPPYSNIKEAFETADTLFNKFTNNTKIDIIEQYIMSLQFTSLISSIFNGQMEIAVNLSSYTLFAVNN